MNALFHTRRLGGTVGIFLICALCLSGTCSMGADPSPDNVYVSPGSLPATLKRVLILPLAHEHSAADLSSGCELLCPVIRSELIKTKTFEVISADAKTVQGLTGQADWTGAEALPPDFFGSLQRVYGCDAVLFCELSSFHAYPPLAVGWRMKLVDLSSQKIIWAADVVFDAGDPSVCKSAEAYQRRQQGVEQPTTFFKRVWIWMNRQPEPATDDQWTILNSPRYFGEFSAATLLQTLPKR
jgi:hypothetical protein